MPFYAGFDTRTYPGPAVMDFLAANTNLSWCAYYLEPAPNRGPTGWQGQYPALSPAWGVLPVYVGQQDPATGSADYRPSSLLTAAQGGVDGADAANLAATEAIAAGSFLFLDWEAGDLAAEGAIPYIQGWIEGVVADGRYQPGVYCSHLVATQIAVEVMAPIVPAPSVRFWCWKVARTDRHDYDGALNAIPAIDPAGCGVATAVCWQRDNNVVLTLPAGAPVASIQVDLSTASLRNPAAP